MQYVDARAMTIEQPHSSYQEPTGQCPTTSSGSQARSLIQMTLATALQTIFYLAAKRASILVFSASLSLASSSLLAS